MDHDREGRDAAGVGPYARERENLVPMSTLASWTVTEGEPDIRGWDVRTVSGRQLGSVADLLVDEAAGEVVMLDIDLPGTDRHTFVPIRVVQIDRTRRIVLMDSADFPDDGTSRGTKALPGDRSSETVGTVGYPAIDREVEMVRPTSADDVAFVDRAIDTAAADRRRNERRRIERVSTDI